MRFSRARTTQVSTISRSRLIEVEWQQRLLRVPARLCARQSQQLINEMRSAVDAAQDLPESVSQFCRIALAHGQLRLRFQAGQRRSHLVRGIGDETLLGVEVAAACVRAWS
jgi:hypothetical protein